MEMDAKTRKYAERVAQHRVPRGITLLFLCIFLASSGALVYELNLSFPEREELNAYEGKLAVCERKRSTFMDWIYTLVFEDGERIDLPSYLYGDADDQIYELVESGISLRLLKEGRMAWEVERDGEALLTYAQTLRDSQSNRRVGVLVLSTCAFIALGLLIFAHARSWYLRRSR